MLSTKVASDIENGEFMVEIWEENEMVGEIRRIDGVLEISIYNSKASKHWQFDLEEFYRILSLAKEDAVTI